MHPPHIYVGVVVVVGGCLQLNKAVKTHLHLA